MDMLPVIRDWLDARSIKLDPDVHERDGIWAEWDGHRGQLHMGWWDTAECPQCNQTDRPERSLVVVPGFGDNNWQHGCGFWWSPTRNYITVTHSDTDEIIQAKLDTLLSVMREEQAEGMAALHTDLTKELRDFLTEHETEEERIEAAYGSETEPGVWRPADGEWEAWTYDPRSTGDTITVIESDLKNGD